MKKILIIAAIWLFVAALAIADEKADLALKNELIQWKSRAIQCETMIPMLNEFKANEAKLKELEAKEKKDKPVKK